MRYSKTKSSGETVLPLRTQVMKKMLSAKEMPKRPDLLVKRMSGRMRKDG